ncbi:N-acetylmuramidase domain-containing protein [Mesorhizobium sp. VNQ89]|uniref:N-acetylmuramidase domain-containing protein n=1 Tax=Mesorhizobium quangtriensis TaxID=3157709 RepID=UPI0032B72F3D
MFTQQTIDEIRQVAVEFGIEPAALLAVAEVESGGAVFALIEGRQEPLIRFEGHYFDRRLSGDALAIARTAGLASPHAGAIVNPASQAARWRLLERAASIDHRAAYESVSWGLGQVMGAHWAWLGFGDIDTLVAEARVSAAGQARLMAKFIDKSALRPSLLAHDWEAFARGYNGPNYRKNAYHTKLASAYRRLAGGSDIPGKADPAPKLLRYGSAGEAVRDLQTSLSALGYPLTVDGKFGNRTRRAVMAFQKDRGLEIDGIVGPATRKVIGEAMPFSGSGWQKIRDWIEKLFIARRPI